MLKIIDSFKYLFPFLIDVYALVLIFMVFPNYLIYFYLSNKLVRYVKKKNIEYIIIV